MTPPNHPSQRASRLAFGLSPSAPTDGLQNKLLPLPAKRATVSIAGASARSLTMVTHELAFRTIDVSQAYATRF
jgi:hypothetical protein